MPTIAFVTTCKNRLDYLQRTLPQWMAEEPDEIIVVDYGCPQGAGDWVEANWPRVKVVRVDDDPGFCVARARNQGAAVAQAEWICFIDADVKVRPGWLEWMRANLREDGFYRAAPVDGVRTQETWGTVIVPRDAWRSVEGFDECFVGWGGEDADLYDRLVLAGYAERDYPDHFVVAIEHSDEERFMYSAYKTKFEGRRFQSFYRYAKYVWMTVAGVNGEVPFEQRVYLRRLVDAAFAGAAGGPGKWPEIAFDVEPGVWVPVGRRVGARCRCVLRLEPQGTRWQGRIVRLVNAVRVFFGILPIPLFVTPIRALEGPLVGPVLDVLHGAKASSEVRVKTVVLLGGLPERQRIRVRCRYELPCVTLPSA